MSAASDDEARPKLQVGTTWWTWCQVWEGGTPEKGMSWELWWFCGWIESDFGFKLGLKMGCTTQWHHFVWENVQINRGILGVQHIFRSKSKSPRGNKQPFWRHHALFFIWTEACCFTLEIPSASLDMDRHHKKNLNVWRKHQFEIIANLPESDVAHLDRGRRKLYTVDWTHDIEWRSMNLWT